MTRLDTELTPTATLTTDDGRVFVIPDLPADLGRATVLASEGTLKRLWETPEENTVWHDL